MAIARFVQDVIDRCAVGVCTGPPTTGAMRSQRSTPSSRRSCGSTTLGMVGASGCTAPTFARAPSPDSGPTVFIAAFFRFAWPSVRWVTERAGLSHRAVWPYAAAGGSVDDMPRALDLHGPFSSCYTLVSVLGV